MQEGMSILERKEKVAIRIAYNTFVDI